MRPRRLSAFRAPYDWSRRDWDEAVDYAVALTRSTLAMLHQRGIALGGVTVLEIGPGANFAAPLAMASAGARVLVADRYLAPWEPRYHPDFYRDFLARWDGPGEAVRRVIAQGGYRGVIEPVAQPAETLHAIGSGEIDLVLSNAVLEHVLDLDRVARELARVTRIGGWHAHQIDLRDHRNFARPLGHLLASERFFAWRRRLSRGSPGTRLRLPEIAALFSRHFDIVETEENGFADATHVAEVQARLPHSSPYRDWPAERLRVTGGRLWLRRNESVLTSP
jgi:SAM-dependent methyltransferase